MLGGLRFAAGSSGKLKQPSRPNSTVGSAGNAHPSPRIACLLELDEPSTNVISTLAGVPVETLFAGTMGALSLSDIGACETAADLAGKELRSFKCNLCQKGPHPQM